MFFTRAPAWLSPSNSKKNVKEWRSIYLLNIWCGIYLNIVTHFLYLNWFIFLLVPYRYIGTQFSKIRNNRFENPMAGLNKPKIHTFRYIKCRFDRGCGFGKFWIFYLFLIFFRSWKYQKKRMEKKRENERSIYTQHSLLIASLH